jgi:hypothetical protein
MSEAEETPALIAVLAEQCRSAAGQRTAVTVRRLLAAYRAERRGRHVLTRIQQDLRAAGLTCTLSADEPPTVDDPLEIRLIGARAAAAPLASPLVLVEHGARQAVGAVIDSRGLIVTSALPVADAIGWGARAAVTVRGAGSAWAQRGCVAAVDREHDTLVLWVAAEEPLPALQLGHLPLDSAAQTAELVADVRAGQLQRTRATVLTGRSATGSRRLRCDTAVAAAALGGPLLIERTIVGIINRRGRDCCFAVPAAALGLLIEQAEQQRRYLLRRLRCPACGSPPAAETADPHCPGCGRRDDEAPACRHCGTAGDGDGLEECCTACGAALSRDDDGLTLLACRGCGILLDDVVLRCRSCGSADA